MQQSWKQTFFVYLKGMLMGAADLIPGVSGGTMALITGIYERLIDGIKRLSDIFGVLAKHKVSVKTITEGNKLIDWWLFVPLALGIGTAVLVGAHAVDSLLANYPGPVFSFFSGLILASAIYVYKKTTSPSTLFGILGILIGVGIALLPGAQAAQPGLAVVFAVGLVAALAMLLPGISGSHILLTLGFYSYILGVAKDPFGNLTVLIVFLLGIITSVIFSSRIISWLLHHHHDRTLTLLAGLMIGSLVRPGNEALSSGTGLFTLFLFFVIGALIVYALSFVDSKK